MSAKERVDVLLVSRGFVESRSIAQRMIMAGQVRVNGELVMKSSQKVNEDAALSVDAGPKYVSRGGIKLEAGLDQFQVSVTGRVCADVGASTGGFTDCMLQRGAKRVYAIDVGKGIIHWRLRNDPRVELMENTNVRSIQRLPENISLCTIDVAFISLRLVFPSVSLWLEEGADLIALIKPQFEAGRKDVGKGGIVRNPAVHQQVIERVYRQADSEGLSPQGLMRSPIQGQKGNEEFLLWCVRRGTAENLKELMARCFEPDEKQKNHQNS